MTPEKKELIEKIATELNTKRLVFEGYQACNVCGLSVDERADLARKSAVAEAEMIESRAALREVQQT